MQKLKGKARTSHYKGHRTTVEHLVNEGKGNVMLLCHAVAFRNVMLLVQIHMVDYTGNILPWTQPKNFNMRAGLSAAHSQPSVLPW